MSKILILAGVVLIFASLIITQMQLVDGYHIDGTIEKHDYEVWPPRTMIVEMARSYLIVGIQYSKSGTYEHWIIYRGYLSFNTSNVLDEKKITNVTLCLPAYSDQIEIMNFSVLVMGGEQPLYGDILEIDDMGCGTVELARFNTVDFPETPPYTYINLTIPPAQINKQGLTQFELKSDIEDVDPTGTSSQRAVVRFWSLDADQSPDVQNPPEPLLIVEYEVPAEEEGEEEEGEEGEEEEGVSTETVSFSTFWLGIGLVGLGSVLYLRDKRKVRESNGHV